MKSYLFRFSLLLLGTMIQMLFIPSITDINTFITVIILIVLSYDTTNEELLAYSFLGGFLVGAMSGGDMFLHLLVHLLVGGILLALKMNHLLPSKHRSRALLLTGFIAIYTFMLIVPIRINFQWWLENTGWSALLTLMVYVLLLPLFSRVLNREQHTLFYGS